jgi:triacylglycerol lipase
MGRMDSVSVLTTALRRPRTYAGWTVEALNAARCAALYPLGLAESALRTGSPKGDDVHDVPVILVHGFGHNRSGWFLLDRELRNAGFSSVHTLNYVAGTKHVPELAERVAAKVEEVRRLTGAEKVHLVGHSLGGVLIRWYVQEMGGDRFVDTAITVASPHEGTVAALPALGRTARDLRPGSAVMRRLACGARPTDVRWIAFYSNLDVLVVPGPSAMLRHPAMRATNIFVKDHGHITIMVSKRVARAIREQLENRDLVPLAPRQLTSMSATSSRSARGASAGSRSLPGSPEMSAAISQ